MLTSQADLSPGHAEGTPRADRQVFEVYEAASALQAERGTQAPAGPRGQPSGAGTTTCAGTGAPKSNAVTSLTACTPSASEPDGPTWYMTATA